MMRFKFFLAFLFTLLGPLFFPKLHLLYFAPYLVSSYYRYSRIRALWQAYGCGIIIDLFSTTPIFGLTSINYCLISLALYNQNRNFFEDKFSTLPLMTIFFVFLSTLLSVILALFTGQNIYFSLKWYLTDLLFISMINGIYAILLYFLPFQIRARLRKIKI